MFSCARLAFSVLGLAAVAHGFAAQPREGDSPADHLPAHISRLTHFGERADWSHDGKKILFLSKTFGDAMELDVTKRTVRNLTSHYAHYGHTRALYLANGDILLAGPVEYDTKNPGLARRRCYLFVLDRSGRNPPTPLGALCNEGPVVSRTRMHIAWTEWTDPKPGEGNLATSQIFAAGIAYTEGKPAMANKQLVIDGTDLGFRCTMETQNFRPPDDREIILSAYTDGGQKCDVLGIDVATKKITRYTDSPLIYDEPEGIFPDGRHTLVECDSPNPKGPGYIDLWKFALDGTGASARLTHFTDFPGYKASNGVVSDDGRFLAFQMGRAGDAAGVGHGIFLYDLARAPAAR